MEYSFDTVISRRGTNCLKYDFARERGKAEDVLPLWVADMDFQAAPEILNRLRESVDHGIFGYTEMKAPYYEAIAAWFKKRFDWPVKREWIVKTPGVVYAISCALEAYTREGEGVLIQGPSYAPFREVVRWTKRKLINSPLVLEGGRYRMNFEELEEKIIKENVRLFILCSPHNPVGRVWSREELERAGDICLRHNVIVLSDEIHCDFVFSGHRHYVFSSIRPEFEKISLICTAPSKTFNLAGLQVSNIMIPDEDLRKAFLAAYDRTGYSTLNTLGLVAAQAAYEEGEAWLDALLVYLEKNLSFIREFLKENDFGIRLIEPEGTYLVWLDCTGLGLDEKTRNEIISNRAGLWLNTGTIFGEDGKGFERVNIACPLSTLQDAFTRLRDAFTVVG